MGPIRRVVGPVRRVRAGCTTKSQSIGSHLYVWYVQLNEAVKLRLDINTMFGTSLAVRIDACYRIAGDRTIERQLPLGRPVRSPRWGAAVRRDVAIRDWGLKFNTVHEDAGLSSADITRLLGVVLGHDSSPMSERMWEAGIPLTEIVISALGAANATSREGG